MSDLSREEHGWTAKLDRMSSIEHSLCTESNNAPIHIEALHAFRKSSSSGLTRDDEEHPIPSPNDQWLWSGPAHP